MSRNFLISRNTGFPNFVQGLELDSNGRIYLRPNGSDLQQTWAEQEAWGASSEKASHAFLENLAVTGARAAGNAGLLLSFLILS